MFAVPTAQEVESSTPADRDRAIDVLRIFALVAVVIGHALMLLTQVRNGQLEVGNALARSVVFQWLTWAFQVMPLFFFAGAAASARSWNPSQRWGAWLLKRCQRLYRPVWLCLAIWTAGLFALRLAAPAGVYRRITALSTQLLWFLGVYVLVLAAVPLFTRITTRIRIGLVLAGLYALTGAMDLLRWENPAATASYLNYLSWFIPAVFGIAYWRSMITPRQGFAVAGTALVLDLCLVLLGPYEPSMVTYPGQHFSNMTPPSLLAAGHATMLCGLAIGLAPSLRRWAERPATWRWVVVGNAGAMTLYLWHLPTLLLVHFGFRSAGFELWTDTPADVFYPLHLLRLVIFLLVLVPVFFLFQPLENTPLPVWDSPIRSLAKPGSALVGFLLVLVGATNLLSARWGLAGLGVPLTIGWLAGLALVRLITLPLRSARPLISALPRNRKQAI